jgi:prepilin-type N-terminal cleavage/methylation domain-containing protein
MAKRNLLSRVQRFWFSSRTNQSKGFTLLELLVVTIIAGGIVSGLMYIVVDLMKVDQREASKNETQREMQLSLDYISTELRDAVYVYDGATIGVDTVNAPPRRNGQSLLDFLPPALTASNNVPVIAFWKQEPFPPAIKAACAAGNDLGSTNCANGSSYALIVYSLNQDNPSTSVWKGKARISRYALTEFNALGARTPGYVNPAASNNNFESWPYGADATGLVNLQAAAGGRPGNAVQPSVLTDFVDNTAVLPNNAGQVGVCPNDPSTPIADYTITPPATVLSASGMANIRSFYACVSTRPALGNAQDVILYVRGNVFGRPGNFGETSFLPALETRILSRGVLGRVPN